MREIFFTEIERWLERDGDGILLAGDVGFPFVGQLRDRFGARVVNAGVAEQSALGIATGLALAGKKIVYYSIAGFPTLRGLEFLRNDVCFHRAEVKIVAAGTGFTYGAQGPSHHAVEDIAALCALSDLKLLLPGDSREAAVLTRAMLEKIPGPCYLRLGISHREFASDVVPFCPRLLREGKDVLLVATGSVLGEAAEAAETLGAALVSLHGLPVADDETLARLCRGRRLVLTIEEHRTEGGIGSWLAARLLESEARPERFRRLGVSGVEKRAYSPAALRHRAGLSARAIVDTARSLLEGR